jgi:hypothetical protein
MWGPLVFEMFQSGCPWFRKFSDLNRLRVEGFIKRETNFLNLTAKLTKGNICENGARRRPGRPNTSGLDRKTYQREYMRRYRASKRAKVLGDGGGPIKVG